MASRRAGWPTGPSGGWPPTRRPSSTPTATSRSGSGRADGCGSAWPTRGPPGRPSSNSTCAARRRGPTAFGLATSGTSVHRWTIDGRSSHHLIDPRTGRPARTDLVQATVLAGSAREAEAIAKTAVIVGSEAALGRLDRPGILGGDPPDRSGRRPRDPVHHGPGCHEVPWARRADAGGPLGLVRRRHRHRRRRDRADRARGPRWQRGRRTGRACHGSSSGPSRSWPTARSRPR